jgi:hypothetical protein
MVSAWRLAQQREMVSQPPEKTCSMATAEPGMEMFPEKNIEDVRTTHQEYIRCHEQGKTDSGTECIDPSTTELDYRHRNLQQEVWSIPPVC